MYMRDSEIVASIVAGDPDGLAAAYDRYADPLYAYCRSMLKDPADAADAVQDTFVIAASRLDGLRDPDRLRAWLYTVARNESLRILRASKGTRELDEAADVTDESADVTQDAERADLRALLRDASEGLNPGEREVIELQLRQGLEAAEVASVLGVSRNHAHSLLSRARDQLEACLGVLLVGRAGREDCGELGTMLSGWDGRLTVLLRKRLNRHIEHCDTCTGRKALVLRPAAFLGLSPLAALAAATAQSARLARAPVPLKSHVLTLATSTGPSAAAHRAAVASRAGTFGKSGFPKPLHAAKAGLAHGAGGAKGSFLKSPQGQAAVAGVVLAAVVASAAFALTASNGKEHLTLAGAKPPAHSSGPGGAGSAPPPSSHSPQPPPKSPAAAIPVLQPAPSTAAPQPSTVTTPPAPPATPASTSPPQSPAGPATTPATPTPPASPSTSPSPSPSQTPTPLTGTLSVTPAGGFLAIPPRGSTFTLTAQGGAVEWNIAVSGGTGRVTLSQSAGTLQSGQSVTVTVTASQVTGGQVLTISPAGATFVVVFGWGQPLWPATVLPPPPTIPAVLPTALGSPPELP